MIRTEGQAAMDNDTMVEVTPDEDYTPAERAFLDSLGGYQKVFNAIADGTSVYAEGVGINITVKGFIKSLARHQSGRTGAGEALREALTEIRGEDLVAEWLHRCVATALAGRLGSIERKARAALKSTAGEDGT